jgi:hypothetical protein
MSMVAMLYSQLWFVLAGATIQLKRASRAVTAPVIDVVTETFQGQARLFRHCWGPVQVCQCR